MKPGEAAQERHSAAPGNQVPHVAAAAVGPVDDVEEGVVPVAADPLSFPQICAVCRSQRSTHMDSATILGAIKKENAGISVSDWRVVGNDVFKFLEFPFSQETQKKSESPLYPLQSSSVKVLNVTELIPISISDARLREVDTIEMFLLERWRMRTSHTGVPPAGTGVSRISPLPPRRAAARLNAAMNYICSAFRSAYAINATACIAFVAAGRIEGTLTKETYVAKNGDVTWRCLAKRCGVSVKTDGDRTRVVGLDGVHTGGHPAAMRTVSLSSTPPRISSPSASPTAKDTRNASTETDALFPNTKDELVSKVQKLTGVQSSWVDKIQSLTLELDGMTSLSAADVSSVSCQTEESITPHVPLTPRENLAGVETVMY
ncbi:hypothetical protein J6590_063142 [Homalodisca vitripennis]|nr:hypothetical protein J6590_063142 [Homalodisca vitripennis]